MPRPLSTLTFTLVLCAAPLAQAQEQASLGLGVGLVKPSDVDSTFWVTANYRFRLGDRLWLEPEAGYWKKGDDVPGLDVSIEDLNFGLNAILAMPGGGIEPWVGAGVGLHLVKGVLGVGGFDSGETETKLGIHLLGGLDFGLADSFDLFAALRYDIVSDLGQFKAYGGLRYKF
ncbi:MAG TPA: outer membrane beta-barrel protein [Vicinamibacteria bacterium]|nr:outer membrane beta-barrel protein [Vicinamibacteria bacterium]